MEKKFYCTSSCNREDDDHQSGRIYIATRADLREGQTLPMDLLAVAFCRLIGDDIQQIADGSFPSGVKHQDVIKVYKASTPVATTKIDADPLMVITVGKFACELALDRLAEMIPEIAHQLTSQVTSSMWAALHGPSLKGLSYGFPDDLYGSCQGNTES